jgi:hypothetical protein
MPFLKRNLVLFTCSLLAILLLVPRQWPVGIISTIQLPDDETWKQSEAADNDFLGLSAPAMGGAKKFSMHFSGVLAQNDMSPDRPHSVNDDKHPLAEAPKKSDISSSHWTKDLILDSRPRSVAVPNPCPPASFCSMVSHLNDIHLGGVTKTQILPFMDSHSPASKCRRVSNADELWLVTKRKSSLCLTGAGTLKISLSLKYVSYGSDLIIHTS